MNYESKEDRAKELQRQYLRNWRSAHKDKVKGYNRAYWIRKADKEMKGENEHEKEND